MSNHLAALDLSLLSTVTGGGTSTSSAQIGVQATVPKLGPVNVGVSGTSSATDYKTCVDAVSGMPGAKPADIATACGMPPTN